MPHIQLDYTNNITLDFKKTEFFSALHHLIVEHAKADLSSCKSRTMVHDHYHISDNKPAYAFVHLNIRLLSGRTKEAKQALSEAALKLLYNHFRFSPSELELQVSVNIDELDASTYCKITR